MTRRLFLHVVLAVMGGLVLAAGAQGQLAAPSVVAVGEPDTVIDSGPPDPSSSSSATFTFHSDDPLATFECSRDGAAFTNCSSPKTYNGLADGSHTFAVQAIGVLGTDPTAATYGWTITTDAAAPETTITSTAIGTTSSTSASFAFTSSEGGSTFECKRDSQASFSPCSSPKNYSGLGLGSHTFYVRATDASDNTDASPATETWTIVSSDSTPPDTTIASGPPSSTSSTLASFTFTSTEGGSTFECRRDSQTFSPCSSPKNYSGLANGTHTFFVRATDPADNTDPTPAPYTWTVGTDSTPPNTTIDSGPIGTSSSTTATFTFSSTEPGSTFECSRNFAAFIPCTSPVTYTALADGTHTFNVRATDPSDNTDATPASATWTVATNTTGVPTVGSLRAIAGDHRVRLVWRNPTGIGIRRIVIRRVGRRLPLYRGGGTEFVDTAMFNDRTYTYSVVVVDDLGHRSPAAGIFARPHGKLRAPRDGTIVQRAPMLRWLPRARATYYNVQVFRANGQKVLSRWPARPRLRLRMQWRYQGRVYRLRNARYVWYVFPGFGARPANHYGKQLGHSTFFKR
jgi:hypothetical protein